MKEPLVTHDFDLSSIFLCRQAGSLHRFSSELVIRSRTLPFRAVILVRGDPWSVMEMIENSVKRKRDPEHEGFGISLRDCIRGGVSFSIARKAKKNRDGTLFNTGFWYRKRAEQRQFQLNPSSNIPSEVIQRYAFPGEQWTKFHSDTLGNVEFFYRVEFQPQAVISPELKEQITESLALEDHAAVQKIFRYVVVRLCRDPKIIGTMRKEETLRYDVSIDLTRISYNGTSSIIRRLGIFDDLSNRMREDF